MLNKFCCLLASVLAGIFAFLFVPPVLAESEMELEERVAWSMNRLKTGGSCNRCYMSGIDLRGHTLYRASLKMAVIRDADLRWAYFEEVDLYMADLRGSDLREASLERANLYDADLRETDLDKASLKGADLSHANLQGAYLNETILSGAILREARLDEADLSGADLRSADFSQSILYNADLSGVAEDQAREGSNVELIGQRRPLDIVAREAGTIGYEILTRISRRITRVYIDGDNVV